MCRQWRACLRAGSARFWQLLLQRLRSPEALPATPPFSQWNTGHYTINWRSAQVRAVKSQVDSTVCSTPASPHGQAGHSCGGQSPLAQRGFVMQACCRQ